MNKNARRTPFVLIVVVTAVLLAVCLAGTILFASLALNQSKNVPGVGVVGSLSATVANGSITVTSDMDCVLRATPLVSSGVTFNSNQWFLQDNGWYYYYKVIKRDDSSKTISLTGATSSNISVELAQAQYALDTTSSNGKEAGFIVEWSSRDLYATVGTLGTLTTDGVDITNGGTMDANDLILMYSGHSANRRIPGSSTDTGATSANASFVATKQSDGSFAFNKVKMPSATSFDTITSSNAITIYNNSNVTVIYAIQIINGGSQPAKNSVFSNGNWTTYITLNSAPQTFIKASDSTATSGYNTYFVSAPISPGQYVDLSSGTDSKLYFDITDTETSIRMSVSSMDTMTFYNNYLNQPVQDKYLAWLKSLDSNYSGKTYYNDFKKLITTN